MKIVITDSDLPGIEQHAHLITDAGIEYERFDDRSEAALINHAADADGCVSSYGQWTGDVFRALPNLKVLGRTGVGFDNIDVETATSLGIAVCTINDYGTQTVADHAIALAMTSLRRTNELDALMRAGTWNFNIVRPLGQVPGRVFGVVGMGSIGRAVAKKAQGLGFEVIVHSRSLTAGRLTPEGYETCTYEELLKRADIISFHTALNDHTHHMLNAEKLALCKPSAIIVNTSRGGIIDTIALAKALEEDRLWGAGIDVFETEPVEKDHPLLRAPHAVLTPHAAYWSEESGFELGRRTVMAAVDVVLGRYPSDILNPEVFDLPQCRVHFTN